MKIPPFASLTLCMACLQTLFAATPVEQVGLVDEIVVTGDNIIRQSDSDTPVATRNGTIYFAYFDPGMILRVVKKAPGQAAVQGTVHSAAIPRDYHHMPSIGVDENGYLHVVAAVHNSPINTLGSANASIEPHAWRYWVSTNPGDVSAWTFITSSSSRTIPGYMVSYPWFATDPSGRLYVSWRGFSGYTVRPPNGPWTVGTFSTHIAKYNAANQTWTEVGGFSAQNSQNTVQYRSLQFESNGGVTGGTGPGSGHRFYQPGKPRIYFDRSGRLHFVTVTNKDGSKALYDYTSGTHVLYAYSDDFGTTWKNTDGSTITTLPMSSSTMSVVASRADGSIHNTAALAFTGEAFPRVVWQYYNSSTSGFPLMWATYNTSTNSWSSSPLPTSTPKLGSSVIVADSAGRSTSVGYSTLTRSHDQWATQQTYGTGTANRFDALTGMKIAAEYNSNHAARLISVGIMNDEPVAGQRVIKVQEVDLPEYWTVQTVGAELGSPTGSITREVWNNVVGTSVADIPVSSPPTTTGTLTTFEAPTNAGDNYGQRICGWIVPPGTGNYTFWIASDDHSELWLSTSPDPASAVRIAWHTSWTNSRQWGKFSTQKSAAIPLQAGQSYYVEALMKEGGYGDNLAVAWRLNNTSTPADGDGSFIIPGSSLRPWSAGSTASISADGTTFTLAGTSTMSKTSEQLPFLAQALTGDFTFTAKSTVIGSGTGFRAGIMARENLTHSSRYVATHTRGGFDWAELRWRSSGGGSTSANSIYAGTNNAAWVRLQRRGNVFRGWYSANGTTWNPSAAWSTTLVLPATLQVGLHTGFWGSSTPVNVHFTDVSIDP